MSGHIIFAHRYRGFDDAVYSSLRLLELLSEGKEPLSARLSDVPATFNTPEIRVTCPDTEKFAVVEKVKRHFQRTHEVNDVDGARVRFEGGWGLVRASNTGPVLVLRFEATSEARLAEIRAEVEAVVSEATGTPLAAAAH
jgi:phosphomannomutase/phosphoglucomutase